MPSNHKSFRAQKKHQHLITVKMLHTGVPTESEAIRMLLEEGGGIRKPVIAKLDHPSNFKEFHQTSIGIAHDLATIKNRITYAPLKTDDEVYNEHLERWQKVSNDLLPRMEQYGDMAAAMFEAMTNLTPKKYDTLTRAAGVAAQRIETIKLRLTDAKFSAEEKRLFRIRIEEYETILEALSLYGISPNLK